MRGGRRRAVAPHRAPSYGAPAGPPRPARRPSPMASPPGPAGRGLPAAAAAADTKAGGERRGGEGGSAPTFPARPGSPREPADFPPGLRERSRRGGGSGPRVGRGGNSGRAGSGVPGGGDSGDIRGSAGVAAERCPVSRYAPSPRELAPWLQGRVGRFNVVSTAKYSTQPRMHTLKNPL